MSLIDMPLFRPFRVNWKNSSSSSSLSSSSSSISIFWRMGALFAGDEDDGGVVLVEVVDEPFLIVISNRFSRGDSWVLSGGADVSSDSGSGNEETTLGEFISERGETDGGFIGDD